MGRPSKPYFRSASQTWCCTIAGRHYTLARGKGAKADALARFHELMVSRGDPARPVDPPAWEVADRFLVHIEPHVGADRFRVLRWALKDLAAYVGDRVRASDLSAGLVTKWLAARGRSRSSDATAIAAVRQCFKWAVRPGKLIAESPLDGLRSPGYTRREACFSREQVRQLLEAIDPAARPIVEFMAETGCRPSEACRLQFEHIDFASHSVTMPGKTTRATGKPRIITLTDRAEELCRAKIGAKIGEDRAKIGEDRAKIGEDSHVFRNAMGKPWTGWTLDERFRAVRARLGWGPWCVPEAIRHRFASDLAYKVNPTVLADLMGHTSPAMVSRYYHHADRRLEERRAALQAARG